MANFKTLLDEVSKVLQTAGVKSSAAGKFIGKFAKPIAFLKVVKDGDAYVKEIPIIGDILSWRTGIQNKIFDSTFGKIPGIGPVLTKISKSTQKALSYQPKARHESKARTNDPSWYTEHLGIHSSFNIPAAYPDRFPIPVAGGTPRVQAAVFRMIYNPNPDPTTTRLRAEQKFALLKGIRGLSAVSYTPGDIINYEECVLACHAEYYGLKRAVKLMQRYDLMKSAWPDALVKQLGYNSSDLREHLAQYKGYLAQCANALHELPITGNMLAKIKLMQSVLFPDCNDGSIATYYGYRLEFVSAVVPNEDSAGTVAYDLLKFRRSSYSTNDLLTNVMKIRSSSIYSLVVADYIGAFGSSCLPAIELDWDTPFNFAAYDENLLTQLQNTDILDIESTFVTQSGTLDVNPTKMSALSFGGGYVDIEGNVPVGTKVLYESKIDLKFLAYLKYTYRMDQSGSATPYIPPVANFSGSSGTYTPGSNTIIPGRVGELSINLPKIGADEGLQLEYIQNKAAFDRLMFTKEGDADASLNFYFKTLNFFCIGCTITYTDEYGNDTTLSIAHTSLAGHVLTSGNTSNARHVLLARTLPSQCDWFPSINYMSAEAVYNKPASYAVSNTMDWNIIGVLGVTGFDQAISYSNFSLKAPAINAGGKSIDNIQEVFNNK